MSGKIFVNYRRDDSAPHALNVAQFLESRFGKRNVFIDIDRLRAGQKFPKVLEERLGQCDVMVAIIGPGWRDARKEDGSRRLDDRTDWVRMEIERALARDIPVIPVLVADAELPSKEELPEPLQSLVDHQALRVTQSGFRHDVAGLAQDIVALRGKGRPASHVAIALVATLLILAIAYFVWAGFFGAETKRDVAQGPSSLISTEGSVVTKKSLSPEVERNRRRLLASIRKDTSVYSLKQIAAKWPEVAEDVNRRIKDLEIEQLLAKQYEQRNIKLIELWREIGNFSWATFVVAIFLFVFSFLAFEEFRPTFRILLVVASGLAGLGGIACVVIWLLMS